MSYKAAWRQREDALVVGAPLVVLPALAIVPVTVSLVVYPAFAHARIVGAVLVPLVFLAEMAGLERLSRTMRREFDVLTLFAGGSVLLFWVVCVCSGVLLALIVSDVK
jgi:hypothetical protein